MVVETPVLGSDEGIVRDVPWELRLEYGWGLGFDLLPPVEDARYGSVFIGSWTLFYRNKGRAYSV